MGMPTMTPRYANYMTIAAVIILLLWNLGVFSLGFIAGGLFL